MPDTIAPPIDAQVADVGLDVLSTGSPGLDAILRGMLIGVPVPTDGDARAPQPVSGPVAS